MRGVELKVPNPEHNIRSVIRLVALRRPPTAWTGQFLEYYDPDAYDGQGESLFTNDWRRAKVFPSPSAALEEVHRVPQARPEREDGKPNKPLTAFDLEIVPLSTVRRETE